MKTQKDALHEMIHESGIPVKELAELLGVGYGYLIRMALPDARESETGSGCSFPLWLLVPAIRNTGNFVVLDQMEESVGRVAFAVPKNDTKERDVCRQAMRATKEFGELMGEVEKALKDDVLKQHERENIAREARHVLSAVGSLLHMVEKKQKVNIC